MTITEADATAALDKARREWAEMAKGTSHREQHDFLGAATMWNTDMIIDLIAKTREIADMQYRLDTAMRRLDALERSRG